MLRRYHGRYRAARIHRFHPAPHVWSRHPVEVPPGDAVLRRHDTGVRSEERRNERSGVGVAVRLEAEKDDVDRPDLGWVVGGVRMGVKVAAWAQDGDPVVPHGLEVLAACDEVDVRAPSVEGGTYVGTDRARANDRDF